MLEEVFSIRRGDFINPDYYVEKARKLKSTYRRVTSWK